MKKYSFLLLLLLCLCGKVWGVDVATFSSDPLNYYYLKNNNSKYLYVLSSETNNQWYGLTSDNNTRTPLSLNKYSAADPISSSTWPTAISFVENNTTYWVWEDNGNTKKNGSFSEWGAIDATNDGFRLRRENDNKRFLSATDDGNGINAPKQDNINNDNTKKMRSYWTVEASTSNNSNTQYYLYNIGQHGFLTNNEGKAALTQDPNEAAKIVINKFTVSSLKFYGTDNYIAQASGTSTSSTNAVDFAIFAANGGFYLFSQNGSEGGVWGIGSSERSRYLRATSANGDCDYPYESFGDNNNRTWLFISESDFTLLAAIITYENAVAAAPSTSDYSHLSTELITRLNNAKSQSFTNESELSAVNNAITELTNAVAAADAYMYSTGLEQDESTYLAGWTKLSSMPSSPENYYYAIVSANTRKTFVAGANSSNQISYQTIADPASDLYKAWIIEPSTNGSYSGSYVLRSLNNTDNIAYASPDSDPYELVINTSIHTNSEANAAYNLVYSDGLWRIQFAKSTTHYWGAWDNQKYVDGERIASNAGGNGQTTSGDYYIYSIPKANYIARYIANGNTDLNFAIRNRVFAGGSEEWSGIGSDKANEFIIKENDNSFGCNIAEMYVGSSNLSGSGDVYQTINLPKGYYYLTAKVKSKNIESSLYATITSGTGLNASSAHKTSGIDERGVVFAITSETANVKIGYKVNGTTVDNTGTDTWVAASTFTLNRVTDNTDITKIIANNNFENAAAWSYGWSGTGSDKAQYFMNQTGTDGNTFKNGTFAEMWVNNSTDMSVGNIYQTITLSQGTYKLSAEATSTNITSYLYASYDAGTTEKTTSCVGIGSKAEFSITFSVPSDKAVQIGYKHNGHSKGSSDAWSAVDNFSLIYVGEEPVEMGGNSNSDWTSAQGNGSNTYKNATETYGGTNGNFSASRVIYQSKTDIPNGRYKLTFYAVANAANGSTTYGNNIAQVYAKTATQTLTQDISVIAQNGCTPTDASYLRTFIVDITDGTLEFGLQNVASGGNWYVVQMDALTQDPYYITTNINGWASFCPSFNVSVPEGLTVYSGTYNQAGSYLTLNEQDANSIAKDDGVLLFGEPSTKYIFEWTSSATAIEINSLSGTASRIANPAAEENATTSVYVLGTHDGETALYKYAGEYIPANKAYLQVSSGSAPSIRIVEASDVATPLVEVEEENVVEHGTLDWNQPVFNVMGQRVNKGAHGILIQNGQKFYVW